MQGGRDIELVQGDERFAGLIETERRGSVEGAQERPQMAERFAAGVFASHVEPFIYREARALIERHRRLGDALVMVLRSDARSRPLLLGTRYTMEDSFLIDHLGNKGIGAVTPVKADRDALHAIIYDQLIKGIVTDVARETVQAMIDRSGDQEADSVIFACTEIGMLFPPTEVGLPGYDTLELHATALVDFALA